MKPTPFFIFGTYFIMGEEKNQISFWRFERHQKPILTFKEQKREGFFRFFKFRAFFLYFSSFLT